MFRNKRNFPFFKQADGKDCGPTCIRIVAKYFGRNIELSLLRTLSETSRQGSNLLGISNAFEEIGIKTLGVKLKVEEIISAPLPCILYWNNNHYVVLYEVKKSMFSNDINRFKFLISDPAHGKLVYSYDEFQRSWLNGSNDGIALLLEATPSFYNPEETEQNSNKGLGFLTKYIFKYKRHLFQLLFGLICASFLQIIFPFLTQSIIDVGIRNQDIHFIYLILFAQIALFIGKTSIEVLRNWILLHISARVNISLISDFLVKLMKLPISFFDTRMTGDLLQRINDHNRVEQILTSSSLNVLFSLINVFVFGLVLFYYNWIIFLIFFLGTVFYFLWIALFLKKRRDLDYKMFSHVSQEQSAMIELISGMQEIKLHNAEKNKRWRWERLQAKLFNLSINELKLEQYQSVGSSFINEFKNILITTFSANLVIKGNITLGMMLAISYIVGQLNSPIALLMNFIREIQDAKISLERLSEIHNKEEEEKKPDVFDLKPDIKFNINNLSFKYLGQDKNVLNDINFNIPSKKITAIVGISGSGKTTLMKILLKFYNPISGTIKIGNTPLQSISSREWRDLCGVVMQEGYIFNDTISSNIAVGEDIIDLDKLNKAIKIANIESYIQELPLNLNTKIGNEGVGLSTGQKQRLLIARAVYKNPEVLFFDEATSALDAQNESIIMNNLNEFFKNKTVIVIAHRLSTVKNADQIIVLDNGSIIETGTHETLIKSKGSYYTLVQNQLELGN